MAAFTSLGPRLSLFTPTSPVAGELVVLGTWLGAAKKHIAKYTDHYHHIAPGARLLLIESSVAILTSRYTVQERAIEPAVAVVRAVLDEADDINRPRILLHSFSNGGTNSLTQLLIVLHRQRQRPLPVVGLVLDSGPAAGMYWKSYRSMLLSLPRGAVSSLLGPLIIHFILVVLYTSVAIGRYEQPENMFRATLVDSNRITNASTTSTASGRICYIYSTADQMVDAGDVASHAATARQKKWDVTEVLFDDTAHCNHLAKHGAEYIRALKDVWEGVD